MTLDEFFSIAVKDMYALVIPEELEQFAKDHLQEVIHRYRCNGILVKQTIPGVAWHETQVWKLTQIYREGLSPSISISNTFGPGVIYTYPRWDNVRLHWLSDWAILRVIYAPGTYRSIYIHEKPDDEQEELLIPPECLLGFSEESTRDYAGMLKWDLYKSLGKRVTYSDCYNAVRALGIFTRLQYEQEYDNLYAFIRQQTG